MTKTVCCIQMTKQRHWTYSMKRPQKGIEGMHKRMNHVYLYVLEMSDLDVHWAADCAMRWIPVGRRFIDLEKFDTTMIRHIHRAKGLFCLLSLPYRIHGIGSEIILCSLCCEWMVITMWSHFHVRSGKINFCFFISSKLYVKIKGSEKQAFFLPIEFDRGHSMKEFSNMG